MLETRLFWWISKMACWPLVGMASTPTWAHVINMDGLGCMGGSSCVKPEKVSSKSFQTCLMQKIMVNFKTQQVSPGFAEEQ